MDLEGFKGILKDLQGFLGILTDFNRFEKIYGIFFWIFRDFEGF